MKCRKLTKTRGSVFPPQARILVGIVSEQLLDRIVLALAAKPHLGLWVPLSTVDPKEAARSGCLQALAMMARCNKELMERQRTRCAALSENRRRLSTPGGKKHRLPVPPKAVSYHLGDGALLAAADHGRTRCLAFLIELLPMSAVRFQACALFLRRLAVTLPRGQGTVRVAVSALVAKMVSAYMTAQTPPWAAFVDALLGNDRADLYIDLLLPHLPEPKAVWEREHRKLPIAE